MAYQMACIKSNWLVSPWRTRFFIYAVEWCDSLRACNIWEIFHLSSGKRSADLTGNGKQQLSEHVVLSLLRALIKQRPKGAAAYGKFLETWLQKASSRRCVRWTSLKLSSNCTRLWATTQQRLDHSSQQCTHGVFLFMNLAFIDNWLDLHVTIQFVVQFSAVDFRFF